VRIQQMLSAGVLPRAARVAHNRRVTGTWKSPPAEIGALLEAPPPPWVALSPDTRWLLLVEHEALPDLGDLARPKLKLAGLRIDPATDARHQLAFGLGLALRERDDTRLRPVPLPAGRRVSGLRWSPDSTRVALTLTGEHATELWVLDAHSGELRLLAAHLAAVLGEGFEWIGDGQALLATLVPEGRAAAPVEQPVPPAPSMQDALGEVSPLRTFQDLLGSPHDEALFEHHARAALARIDVSTGAQELVAAPAIFLAFDPAPGGRHVLLTRVERPYSYQHAVQRLPAEPRGARPRDAHGARAARGAAGREHPDRGRAPGPARAALAPAAARDAALARGARRRRPAPRGRAARPLDGARAALRRPAARARCAWSTAPARCSGFADGERYLTREYDRERRWTRLVLRHRSTSEPLALLDDRSVKDRYGDPGGVLLRPIGAGRRVVREEDGCLLRASEGESALGARPFLDRQELASGARVRLFESAAGEYESPHAIVDQAARSIGFVTRHESPGQPPNLRLRRWDRPGWSAITEFSDPTPALRAIRKELVHYRRADGVELSGTLYLPPGREGQRLPLVIWAYPRDYVDPDTAGQVRDTPHTFTRLGGPSPLAFVLDGYAVLDDASMPIVGTPESMNDQFVEQSVASARAAIEHLAERGVCDPARVGIGGTATGLHGRHALGAQPALPRRHRAQRGLQPHADALRLPERAPHPMGGARQLPGALAAARCGPHARAAAADPRRRGLEPRHAPAAVRAPVPGHQGHGRDRALRALAARGPQLPRAAVGAARRGRDARVVRALGEDARPGGACAAVISVSRCRRTPARTSAPRGPRGRAC
jgi:dipeptidyl aminopeptidase/acylaminoacyl peptidase